MSTNTIPEAVASYTRALQLTPPASQTVIEAKAQIAEAVERIAHAAQVRTCDIAWCQSFKPGHTEHGSLEMVGSNSAGDSISVGLRVNPADQRTFEEVVVAIADQDGVGAKIRLSDAQVRGLSAALGCAISRRAELRKAAI